MYEEYTRQSLPPKNYRELLGSAICVFNSNNSFVIENILRTDYKHQYDWYRLIDFESGKLNHIIKETISKKSDETIANAFENLVDMRNRIVHSFQVTHNGEQILATKTKHKDGDRQFIITNDYLLEFITKNEELSTLLHNFRGY